MVKKFIFDAAKLMSSGFVEDSIREKRIKICESCEDYLPVWIGGEYNKETNSYGIWTEKITCRHCGCNMPWKTKFNSASCPIGKW